MPIPLKTALIGGDSGAEIAPERLIILDQVRQSVTFEGVAETPLLSINRDFSAPVAITSSAARTNWSGSRRPTQSLRAL